MGLDFVKIQDVPGSALFFIHDGTAQGESAFKKLLEDVQTRTRKQCILLSISSSDARNIIAFYQLRGSHFVILVGDDDQLHHVWSDGERFDASQIAMTAERMG